MFLEINVSKQEHPRKVVSVAIHETNAGSMAVQEQCGNKRGDCDNLPD
jgi:hypothetical protein